MFLRRASVVMGLFLLALFVGACQSTGVREQAFTGEPSHERHDTGVESQVGDHR